MIILSKIGLLDQSVHLATPNYQQKNLQIGRGGKACGGDSGSPLMVFDTTKSPPTWIHIGIVHGGVVCSDFYKNLDFPEIFSRTEDSEVLEFIKNIIDGDDYYDGDCDFYSEDYEDCISNQCKTVDGASCVFPFIFRGKEFANCISTPPRRTLAWCPTEIRGVRGEWGYCEDQWFKTESCNNGCHGNY